MDELVRRSERLAMEVNSDLDMPRIQRNLSQLLEVGNQLWNKAVGVSANKDVSDVRASVLLGTRGYDYQKVSRNLDTLITKGVKHYSALTSQPTQTIVRETDIQGFLKNERENAILQVIEEIKQSSKDQVENQYWHTLSKDWDREKLALLNSFIGPDQEFTDLELNSEMPLSSTIISRNDANFSHENFSRPKSLNLDYQEAIYAKCIINYVDSVVSSGFRPDFVENFISYIQKEIVDSNINELWETIGSVVSCCDSMKCGPKPQKTRQSSNFQIKFVRSSRQLLEKKYSEQAQMIVHGNLIDGEMDSQACYTLIKSFLSLKSPSWLTNISVISNSMTDMSSEPNDGTVDGHPVWSFIWHCLRAGMVEAAIAVAQRSQNAYIADEFAEILRCYIETESRRLPSKYDNQLRSEYKRSVFKSNDIYKKSVYCLLASCDLTFNDFNGGVEDLLWIKLCQVRFEHNFNESADISPVQQSTPVKTTMSQPAPTSKLTLSHLQHVISEEVGEAHFNAQESPLSYFKILFLTGLFEQAIEFLSRFQRFKTHAIHIAIALNEVGLLITPESYMNSPILSKLSPINDEGYIFYNLNFVNLLMRYTTMFSTKNTTEALYYYYLLRNFTTQEKENLFIHHVSELARQTGDYDNLLGFVNDFGRIGGVIDRFHMDVDEIVSKVAEDCENDGHYEAAVKLYDSTSRYGKVLEILTKLLSQVLPARKSDRSERNNLENLALRIANRYCELETNAPREIAGTFYLLLDLMAFFNHYHASQHSEALDIIKKLKLLPFNPHEVEIKAREFNKYPEEIRRNIADILLATMNMLYIVNKEQPSAEIRQIAKSLITFSGMIQYRMPSEAIARLIELEVLID